MKRIYLAIPVALALAMAYYEKLGVITLKEMDEIDLSTLMFVFPVILALVERFNELIVVKKKNDPNLTADSLNEIVKSNFNGAVMASFSIGILLAIAGFRILEYFIDPPASYAYEFGGFLFRFLDCVLTAAVIAGGADGWHQIVALITDKTKNQRKEAKAELEGKTS
ncbi:hypothetical protein [Seonamhaeicola sp.]|uniref:hypothetical protein n=1 Tax=Seonamhaeicola sp. TaxID=1912245 RepID=UPI0026237734|nr:hypothetical protein [Seonamhaeicola sp.]